MIGGLEYASVELLIKQAYLEDNQKKLDEALSKAQKTLSYYEVCNIEEHIAKAHSQIGRIYIIKKDFKSAIDSFICGLNVAEASNHKVEKIKNNMGLAVAYHYRNNKNMCEMHCKYCEKYEVKDMALTFWAEVLDHYMSIKQFYI